MKKILVAFLMTTLSLTACSSNDEPTPTKTVFVQPENEGGTDGSGQVGVSEVEQEFLYDISLYNTPELAAQAPGDLINLGRIICDAFDEGASLEQIVEAGQANGQGLSQDSLVTVAASAAVNFCPEHNTADNGDVLTG